MTGKVYGIEIGNDTVKIAVCAGKEIKSMACKRMPENMVRDGLISNMAAMSEFLKEMCKENGYRPGKCAIVLPQEVVMARKVKLPVMSASELELNLPFEFRDFVGRDGAKYYYDYTVQKTEGNTMELYAAAVRKDLIDEYDAMLRKAGFSLRTAIPAEMALQNLVNSTADEPEQVCIVDVGHSTTTVSIFANGAYEMGRTLEKGSFAVDQEIAQAQNLDIYVARTWKESNMENILVSNACAEVYNDLAIEVMRVVGYYQSATPDGFKLKDIYYCGGGSLLDAQRTKIIKRTNLTMHHIRRLLNVTDAVTDDMITRCALAAGAGIQA